MKFRPLGDCVLIQRLEGESKTKGGILIPDAHKEKPQAGKVLAVGNGKRFDNGERFPVAVAPGDRVLFAKFCGCDVKIDGEKCVVVSEGDILGILGTEGLKL